MNNKMYDMQLKDLAIVIERIPYQSENVPVSSLADIMKPNSGRIENISAKSPIIYIERYEKQSCPSFDRHQKLNCQPLSPSQSNPHFRRNSFLKPADNRHEVIKSFVSESVDSNSKNISEHDLKKLVTDVCIVLDTNDVSRKLLKINTSETSCLSNTIDSVEKENIGCSDFVDVSRNIEKSISREQELLGKISQVVISGEMCAAKTAEIVDLVGDSPAKSVVNVDVETINVDVDSPDITEVTPVITENYQISDDEEPVSENLGKNHTEIFQQEIVDVDENSVNLDVEINPYNRVGNESGKSSESNKKVLVESEQDIIDLDEGTLDQPPSPKISGQQNVCVAETLPGNVRGVSEAKKSNSTTQVGVSIKNNSVEPPVSNERGRAVANRVDGKSSGVVNATGKIEMPSLSKFAPCYLDTASLVKERRRNMKNTANNSSSNNSRAGQATNKELNSVLNKSDVDIDFDVSLGKRLSRSKPVDRYKDADKIRRDQSESERKNAESKSSTLKGGDSNQSSGCNHVSKTKNDKLSQMINLAEIKRELEENPINIFEGNSETFGFGADDINIFESDAAVASEVSKPGRLPNNNISDLDIEQLKLHYNIRALKVVITDIYRSKSKLDELIGGKVNRTKESRNLAINGNDGESRLNIPKKIDDNYVNVLDEEDDDDQNSDTNVRYNDIDSHKNGSRHHRHHPTGKSQSHSSRSNKEGSHQSLPTKVLQQDKIREVKKSMQMNCEGLVKENLEKKIKQAPPLDKNETSGVAGKTSQHRKKDGDCRLSHSSDIVADSRSGRDSRKVDSKSRHHPNNVDDSPARPANKTIDTRSDKAESEMDNQRSRLGSDKYAKDESRSGLSNKKGDSRLGHSNKDGSSHSRSKKDDDSHQPRSSKQVDRNHERHKKTKENDLYSDDDEDDVPLKVFKSSDDDIPLKFLKSKDSDKSLKKGLTKSANPLSPLESGDPREVSESFEETVARKLAERNKRLGIKTSTDFSRCRSPSPPPKPSRKPSDVGSKKSKETSENSCGDASAVTTPSFCTIRSTINVPNSKPDRANKTTKTVSSEKALGNKTFERTEKRNSEKSGHADIIQIRDRETISSRTNNRQSSPLLTNSPRKINNVCSQSTPPSSPTKSTSNRSADGPIVHSRSADFMHPSMRMSLLSKKSVEKSKADSVTNLSSPGTSDTATDKIIPHHPSLRLSQVLNKPANLGDSPSKSQNVAIRENIHHTGERRNVLGVTRPKPRPLSRQVGSRGSRGILLSPQSAKSRRTWESNNLLNSSMESELDVIGISDTESESSSGSALVMTQVFHISSDDESENEGGDRLNEPVIETNAVNVLGIPSTSPISNSNDLAEQSTAPSLSVTSECAAVNSMTTNSQHTFECFIIPSDDEDTVQNLSEMRRRRKTSSKNRIETFIAKPSSIQLVSGKNALTPAPQVRPVEKVSAELPKVITPFKKPKIQTISKAKPEIRSVTHRQLQKLTDHFKLCDLEIKAVKLSDKETENLIKLCTEKPIWNAKDELRKAGLSKYDIERLGVKGLRIKSSSRYTFRQFLRKRQRYDIDALDTETKKLKELRRRQKLAEKQRVEVIAIRRALLKINARFLNQSRFWTYLDRKERNLLYEP